MVFLLIPILQLKFHDGLVLTDPSTATASGGSGGTGAAAIMGREEKKAQFTQLFPFSLLAIESK